MATKTLCDCGCGKPLSDLDAADVPSIYEDEPTGLLLEVRILRRVDRPAPAIRPGCIPELVNRAARLFPHLDLVEDPTVQPIPLARAGAAR